MSKNFEVPQRLEVNCKVIGVKEGSNKREVLFETTDHAKFLEAYKYYFQAGGYVLILKEYEEVPIARTRTKAKTKVPKVPKVPKETEGTKA